MATDTTPQKRIASLFTQQPCWMIRPLASELGYSVPSVRRFMGQVGYYSSFTHNGSWYTLRSIPQFGKDGLWFLDAIGFSRAGSLTDTIINLTVRSPAGMTAEQLGEKLRCRCHSILVQLYRRGKLQRWQRGRAYLYLAVDAATQAMQRQAVTARERPTAQLSAAVAVFILAEFIRHPDSSFEQLAQAVARSQRITIKAAQVETLFTRHDLKKKMLPAAPGPYGP